MNYSLKLLKINVIYTTVSGKPGLIKEKEKLRFNCIELRAPSTGHTNRATRVTGYMYCKQECKIPGLK